MATFIRPRSVTVVEGGSVPWPALVAVAAVALSGVLATVLADIIDAALIVSAAAVAALGAVLAVKVRRGRMLVMQRGPAWSGIAASPVQAIPVPPRRAIEAAPVLHLHFYGLAPEDAAVVVRQAAIGGRP